VSLTTSYTIHKFPVGTPGSQFTARMPAEAKMLTVQMQDGKPFMWALVDQHLGKVDRRFITFGTGWELEGFEAKHMRYIGTFQDGQFVWHLFELKPVLPI
jgi:hypothetical protein